MFECQIVAGLFRKKHTFPPENICIIDFHKLNLSPINFYANTTISSDCFSSIPYISNVVLFSDRPVDLLTSNNIFCNLRMVSELIDEINKLKPDFYIDSKICFNDQFTDTYYELGSRRICNIAADRIKNPFG